MFNGLVNSFEDVEVLERWAIEYGHYNEVVVQERLRLLRSASVQQSIISHISPQCLLTSKDR